jgi:hypothetical protein
MLEGLFKTNTCIVIHGPILYVDRLLQSYNDYKEAVIISTNDITEEYLTRLRDNGYKVLLNKQASIPGRYNFNNRVINTHKGIIEASSLGFDYIFNIRADIFISDIQKLINKFSTDTIYFPAYHLHDGGYLCDHMLFGNVQFMEKLWNIPVSESNTAPEVQLTHHFDNIQSNQKIDYIFPILYKENITAYWEKYNKLLNDYKKDLLFVYER